MVPLYTEHKPVHRVPQKIKPVRQPVGPDSSGSASFHLHHAHRHPRHGVLVSTATGDSKKRPDASPPLTSSQGSTTPAKSDAKGGHELGGAVVSSGNTSQPSASSTGAASYSGRFRVELAKFPPRVPASSPYGSSPEYIETQLGHTLEALINAKFPPETPGMSTAPAEPTAPVMEAAALATSSTSTSGSATPSSGSTAGSTPMTSVPMTPKPLPSPTPPSSPEQGQPPSLPGAPLTRVADKQILPGPKVMIDGRQFTLLRRRPSSGH